MELKIVYEEINSRFQKINFTLLWKDFYKYPFAVYNDEKVYIEGKTRPWDKRFIGNTAIDYEGKQIAIWNCTNLENPDFDLLTADIIHEMFHCFQKDNFETRYPDDFLILDYPDNFENYLLKFHENKLLAEAISSHNQKNLISQFIAIRKKRREIIEHFLLEELKIETIEGSAEYISLMALKQLSKSKFNQKVKSYQELINKPSLLFFDIRRSAYFTGALFLLVMEDKILNYNLFHEKTHFELLTTEFTSQEIVVIDNQEIKTFYQKYLDDKKAKFQNFFEKKPQIINKNFSKIGYDLMNMIKLDNHLLCLHFVILKDEKTDENIFLKGPIVLVMKERRKGEAYYKLDSE